MWTLGIAGPCVLRQTLHHHPLTQEVNIMAKINARGTRQKGMTYFTERLRPAAFDGDVDTIYYEAWRLRSDGWIQSRIIATWPAGGQRGDAGTTEHKSTFTSWKRLTKGDLATPVDLETILTRIKADVVKRG
jgi:hypothetical protein